MKITRIDIIEAVMPFADGGPGMGIMPTRSANGTNTLGATTSPRRSRMRIRISKSTSEAVVPNRQPLRTSICDSTWAKALKGTMG